MNTWRTLSAFCTSTVQNVQWRQRKIVEICEHGWKAAGAGGGGLGGGGRVGMGGSGGGGGGGGSGGGGVTSIGHVLPLTTRYLVRAVANSCTQQASQKPHYMLMSNGFNG